MEKISQTLKRNVLPDEKLERERFKLRTERQSLYLQLSSEFKKRDSLFLADYSDFALKRKIKEEDKAIEEIQKKINANLKSLKESETESAKKMASISSATFDEIEKEKNELELLQGFFKRIFTKEKSVITEENISFYRDDITQLYTPTPTAKEKGYLSGTFEKEIYNAGINCFLTGTLSSYGDYCSVAVDVYLYPGAKKIGSVMEVGTLSDIDLITTSLANQIVPSLTNSMPVLVYLSIIPSEQKEHCQLYVDDIIQAEADVIMLESGVHNLKFVAEGYKNVSTSYYFEGNTNYQIEVELKEKTEGDLQIKLRKSITGDIFVNGEPGTKVTSEKTQIKINGNKILGEFINEDGETAFFYVPDKYIKDQGVVTIKPKPYDREKNIDTRRKWMYASYSMLIVSLIPTFYTYGNLMNDVKLYKDRQMTYQEAIKSQNAYNICSGISIGCGVFFAFEMLRYFIAANAVLPEKAKAGSPLEFEQIDLHQNDNKEVVPEGETQVTEDTENELVSGE